MGRDVWIVGASRGLGLAIAREFPRLGLAVVGLARTRPADTGDFDAYATADVSDLAALERVVADLLAERGTPELVVYCVSQVFQGPVATRAAGELERELRSGYLAFVHLAQILQRLKPCGDRLRLVATASTLGYVGCPSLDNYSAAKAALISFVRSARHEMAQHGIALAVISPPHMENGADLRGPQRFSLAWSAPRFARAAAGRRQEYLLGGSNRLLLGLMRWAPFVARRIMTSIGADALKRGAASMHP